MATLRTAITIVAAALTTLLAPGPAAADVGLGVVAGIDLARLFQTDSSAFSQADYAWRGGLAVGARIELGGPERRSLRLEPGYVERGASFPDPDCPCLRPVGYVPGQNELRLAYVDLPVLVVWPVGGAGSAGSRGYLMAGVVGSYLASAEARRNGFASPEPTAYLRRWDVGPTLGGGLRFGKPSMQVGLEARIAVGLLPLDDSSSRNLAVLLQLAVERRRARP